MILAVDTSGKTTSVALLSEDGIHEVNFYGKMANSALLFSQGDFLLKNAKII